MKTCCSSPARAAVLGLSVVLALAVTTPAATAADFALTASYWDTDVAGDTAGGGLILGLPINDVFAFEVRATYFEELTDDPLRNAFDSDDPVFRERGIKVLPVEAGVRFRFAPGAMLRPHIGGGLSYFLLDSDFGEIDDELGYYAVLGATIGDGQGADFFLEGTWRSAEAQVRVDPDDFDDIDDIDVDDRADVNLDGIGVNLGVRWTF